MGDAARGTVRIQAAITGDLEKVMRQELDDARGAVTRGVTRATEGLKLAWRREVVSAGLSTRLSNTIRAEVYPKGRESRSAAGLVYVKPGKPGRWGSAVAILTNLSKGAVIRARNARYLAIPTENVPRKRGRGNGGRMSPTEVEDMYNRDLVLVKRPGRPALLIMPGLVSSRSGKTFRSATSARAKRDAARTGAARGEVSVVMFVLVAQVTIARRIDFDKAGREWADKLPGLIVAEFRDK